MSVPEDLQRAMGLFARGLSIAQPEAGDGSLARRIGEKEFIARLSGAREGDGVVLAALREAAESELRPAKVVENEFRFASLTDLQGFLQGCVCLCLASYFSLSPGEQSQDRGLGLEILLLPRQVERLRQEQRCVIEGFLIPGEHVQQVHLRKGVAIAPGQLDCFTKGCVGSSTIPVLLFQSSKQLK